MQKAHGHFDIPKVLRKSPYGIAQTMNLPQAKQNEIRLAGLLHDIGKLGVSNLILDKPAKLTDDEYEQMKTHTDLYAKNPGPCFVF